MPAEARRLAVELTGRSLSAQAFALAPKVLEAADEVVQPALGGVEEQGVDGEVAAARILPPFS